MQRPAQVLSCEYCQILKRTYFEKKSVNGCFWKSRLEWQIYQKEVIPEFHYSFKAFGILNFVMTKCLLFSQTYLYHKKVHIKWDVVISSSLILLMIVWVWYRCQNRIKNYYHHDGEQLGFYKKYISKHRANRRMFW